MVKRSWIRNLALAAAVFSAGTLGFVLIKRATEPAWYRAIREKPLLPVAKSEAGKEAVYLHNTLLRLPRWKSEEANHILALFEDAARVQDLNDASPELEWRRVNTAIFAAGVVGERFRIGAPITADARASLKAGLLTLAKHPLASVRFSIPSVLTSSGLIEEPDCRAVVESLASDPDPGVAATARNNLHWFDQARPQWNEYKARRDDRE